jgi:hypothetical protein
MKEMALMAERFSVCQFFEDGRCEFVRNFVDVKEAMRAAYHYTTSIGARMGTTRRVIITDEGDCINFEWRYGMGITFPPRGST